VVLATGTSVTNEPGGSALGGANDWATGGKFPLREAVSDQGKMGKEWQVLTIKKRLCLILKHIKI
jgi:hypothetical protein